MGVMSFGNAANHLQCARASSNALRGQHRCRAVSQVWACAAVVNVSAGTSDAAIRFVE